MAYVQWMITNISLLVITVIALIGNGLITFLIFVKPALRNKSANYLIAALTTANFVLCVVSLPYETILVVGLVPGPPNLTNFSAAAIIYSSTPFVGGTMLTSVLVLAIAWDRLHALIRPVSYRSVNHMRQTVIFCTFGFVLGVIMMLINVIDGNVHLVNPGCAAGGCFWGEYFRIVWAIVAVVLNSLTTIISVALMIKLRQHQKSVIVRGAAAGASTAREEKAFMRANIIAMYILAGSTLFITLPFLVNGFSTMVGSLVFNKLGPFVAYGVFCAAAFNVIVYGFKQQDIREHLIAFFECKSSAAKISNATTISTVIRGISVPSRPSIPALRSNSCANINVPSRKSTVY